MPHIPQNCYPTVAFPIDRIIARQHGGQTILSNLGLSCLHCNSRKGSNIAGVDPKSNKITRLFHPRRHKWARRFRREGARLVGRTALGPASVIVLAMNAPEVVEVRRALIEERRFPPS